MKSTVQRQDGEQSRLGIVHEKKDDSTIKVTVYGLTESGELGEVKDTIELVRKKG